MPVIEHSFLGLLIWAVLGYGLGSIPFGMVITKLMGLGNLREIGSGTIGATNVLRTGNKLAAAATPFGLGSKVGKALPPFWACCWPWLGRLAWHVA